MLVVGEMRARKIDFGLVVMADQGHQHRGVDVQLSHAADEGVPEAVENLALAEIVREAPSDVFPVAVRAGL